MRHFLTAALFASTVVLSLGATANAAPSAAFSPTDQVTNESQITQVDRRCGRHAHFVPRHRFHGRLVRGACVRNGR